ncbi:hypothetical protein P4S72_18155, partial [Vibrio sp. PP-XX7]
MDERNAAFQSPPSHRTLLRLYFAHPHQLPAENPQYRETEKFCADQDLAFADIFPMDDKFHRRSFRRLQRAYIDARYSMHYEITEEELAYLGSEVEKLKALVEKCVWRGFTSEEPY